MGPLKQIASALCRRSSPHSKFSKMHGSSNGREPLMPSNGKLGIFTFGYIIIGRACRYGGQCGERCLRQGSAIISRTLSPLKICPRSAKLLVANGDSMDRAFPNRAEAGRLLAEKLKKYAGRDDVIVLGLPRGGVPVAYEVARALNVPLDVFLVRKLGFPGHEELAMGAIATGGVRILDWQLVQMYGVPPDAIERVTMAEQRELERRERLYRDGRPAPDVKGHTV